MKKVNDFEYEENGVVLLFVKAPLSENETVQKYTFQIKDNSELTEKVMAAVKNKKVKERDISFCAKAIFEILKKGSYKEELMQEKEMTELYQRFQLEFGRNPEFIVKDLSTPDIPNFSAELQNGLFDTAPLRTGRTKQQAKAATLKEVFEAKELQC